MTLYFRRPWYQAFQKDWRISSYLPSLAQCPCIHNTFPLSCGHFNLAPVLWVDHSSACSTLHPHQTLGWLISHVGRSASSGKPRNDRMINYWFVNPCYSIPIIINLSSFFPPLAFLCLWRKRTSMALEKTAERQRTATPCLGLGSIADKL